VKKGSEFSEGLAVGVMVGAIGFVAFVWIALHVAESNVNVVAEMFATMAALLGGWFALHGVRQQIQSNLEIEQARNESKLAAARSVLPLALANIADVSRNNIRRHFHSDAIYDGSDAAEFQSLDASIIGIVKECIEFSPDIVSRRLAKIMACYQILHSRRATVGDHKLTSIGGEWTTYEHRTIDDVINWAVVHEMASSLFKFARNGDTDEVVTIGLEDACSALRNAGVIYENFDKLTDILKRRETSGFEMDFGRK